MPFRVSEQFVEAKWDGRVCEDLIVVTDDFAAVIDGASDATGAQFDGKAGGRFAAEVVAAAIHELQPDADARQFVDSLTLALEEAVRAAAGDLGGDIRWPAATVACASAHRREVWRVGDCNVVIGETEHRGGKRVDDVAYSFRAALNSALLAKGTPVEELLTTDPGQQAARSFIDIQQHLANVVGPWGYGCINAKPVPDEYIDVMPVPSRSMQVILTSDGFPVVCSTLRESEAALAGMVERDPAAIDELRAMGKPLKPGANAPDDRAYLRFTIE